MSIGESPATKGVPKPMGVDSARLCAMRRRNGPTDDWTTDNGKQAHN